MPIPDATDPDAARLLADTARSLAAAGATADDVFPAHLSAVPDDLREALGESVTPPDRVSGRRVVRGVLSGFGDPGPTPGHWKEAQTEDTRALDIAIVLVASVLGRVFGWGGQQDGRLVHNIVPSPGQEHLQVGASSTTPLEWHTEDAFHRGRAQLLLLACIRNDDEIGSRVASLRETGMSEEQLAVLSRPEAAIVPDDSYPDVWRSEAASDRLCGISTVWPADDGPCLRYDPYYSRFLSPTPDFTAAYEALGRALDACGDHVVAGPGDVLLIDNDIAAHGRAAYRPRYDGTDRWLKRALIRLPRSRPASEALESDYTQDLVEPGVREISR